MEKDKLLVVDDDASFLDLMAMHLSNKGYAVERALNGKEALHLLRASGPFEILVTDLMMPGLSGLELLRRAREIDPNLEVIVITAAGSLEMAISALREDGAFDYLTKPLDLIGELSLAVERASEHRKLRLERETLREEMVDGAGRLKAILTHTGDAILAVNQNDEIIVASPSLLKLMTQKAKEANNDGLPVPKKLAKLVSDWEMLGSPPGAAVEARWPNQDLQSLILSPLSQDRNEPAGWVMMLQRISKYKVLEDYVCRRIDQIEKELHLPLQEVLREIDRLTMDQPGLEASSENALKTVRRTLERSLDSLAELQGSFITSPFRESESTKISLPLFVENERKQIGAVFEGYQSVKPVWEIEDGLHQLQVELSLLHHILHLLLLRATALGEDKHRVKISFWHRENALWFEISDIGPGSGTLEPEIANRIALERKEDWMGKAEIQLALVKSLVDKSDGFVWHYLNYFGGSTVAVNLPL